jgi:hypothetical protein
VVPATYRSVAWSAKAQNINFGSIRWSFDFMPTRIFHIHPHVCVVDGGQSSPGDLDGKRIGVRSLKRLRQSIDRFVFQFRAACRSLRTAQECCQSDGRCESTILHFEDRDYVERQHAEPHRIGVPQLIEHCSVLYTLSKEWNLA